MKRKRKATATATKGINKVSETLGIKRQAAPIHISFVLQNHIYNTMASNNNSSWSLCLVASTRKIVKVDPNRDTVSDLYRIASEALEVAVDQIQSLKTGFPPKPLDSKDTTLLKDTHQVSNQERVQVTLLSQQETSTASAATTGKKGTTKKQNGRTEKKGKQTRNQPPSLLLQQVILLLRRHLQKDQDEPLPKLRLIPLRMSLNNKIKF